MFPDSRIINYEAEILAEALHDFEFGRNTQVLALHCSTGIRRTLHVMFSNFQYATKPRRSGKIHSNPSFFNSLKISRDIRDGKLSYLPAFMPDSQADALPSIILQFSKISRDVRDGKLSYLFYMLLRRQKDSTPHL